MKRIALSNYTQGIQDLQRFIIMMGAALQEALPKGKFQKEMAFAWRGYQILKYPGLKEKQYYFTLHTDNPQMINFYEYFDLAPHPFSVDLDLVEHNFFALAYVEQQRVLVDFLKTAVAEAILWNASEQRKRIVGSKRL